MKMEKSVLSLFLFFSFFSISAQESTDAQNLDANLKFYADVMINALEPSSRIRAAAEFDKLFQSYLETEAPFTEERDFHKFISVLEAPKQEFKLVSWLIKGEEEQYDFRGYLVRKDGRTIPFTRDGNLAEDLAFSTSTDKDWYGCLYYKLMKTDKKNSFLVFGYDPNGLYDNQKIIDVITVNDDGVDFGKEMFEDKENKGTFMNRLVLRYSSDAAVTLNYDEKLKMLVHDHLQSVMGFQDGQGPTMIPDGTYEGYYLKDGRWLYKEKLFNHVYEEAPRPQPVFMEKEEKK